MSGREREGKLKKAFSRADLLELQASVSKLHRDLDLQSALASDSSQSLEYVGGQVEALRNAYSTLSDVMVDEIEAVRTECRALRREVLARASEAEAQRNRTSKAMKALRVELAAMKEEAQRQRTEIAALRARAADTSLATKVAAMQDELTAVREDNRVLRQSVDTTVGGLREQVGAVAAETSELRHQTAELARLGAEVESLKEHVKEEQRHNAVVRGGIASCADGVQKLRTDITDVRSSLASLKQNHHAAATALAQDVALLAEDAAAAKARTKGDNDKISTKLKSLAQQLERQRADGASALQTRLVSFKQEVTMQQEMFRQAVTMMQKQQSRLKTKVDEEQRSNANQVKNLETCITSLESGVASQMEEVEQRIIEQAEESRRQFEAVSHAVHAFADIMHVSSPLQASQAGSTAE